MVNTMDRLVILTAIVGQAVMRALRELQVQLLALVFGSFRLALRIPKWYTNKRKPEIVRESPPNCLFDPQLGRHLFVKINDTKYHYVESGSRRQEMILCLHDFEDFWYGWRNQLKGFSHSNWVVAPDLKGFGDSDKPFIASKYNDEVIIEDLKKFIDVLQESERQVVLIGHGLGGQIAWKFVEKYPNMVSKFISISTPHPRIWLKHVMRSWKSMIENRWLYVCRLPFLPEMEMVANDVEVFDKKSSNVTDLTNYSNFDKEAYKYTFSRTTDWQGPINYLRNLPLANFSLLKDEGPKQCIPVEGLLLVGNMDPEVSLEMVTSSAEFLDRAATQIVNGASHSPHQEQPVFVNKIIAKFIDGFEQKGTRTTKQDSKPRNFQTHKGTEDISYVDDVKSRNFHAYNMNKTITNSNNRKPSEVSEEENNNEVNPMEFQENKIIPYKTPVSKALEYGSNMINSYKAPVDKAVESSSNLISAGITDLTNRVTKIPAIEQYVPWLAEEEE